MISSITARGVVIPCIQVVGGLTPSEPIRMQDELGDLRIRTEQHFRQLRTRIVEMLEKLEDPCELDEGFLRGIDTSTIVRELIEIVARNANKKTDIDAERRIRIATARENREKDSENDDED